MKLQPLLEERTAGKVLALKLQQLILDDEHGDHLRTRVMQHDEGYELSVWNDTKTVDFWCVIKDEYVYAPGGWSGEEDDDELQLVGKDILNHPTPEELYKHMVELGCYTWAIFKRVKKANAYEIQWDQDYVSFTMYPNEGASASEINVSITLTSNLSLRMKVSYPRGSGNYTKTDGFNTLDACFEKLKQITRS